MTASAVHEHALVGVEPAGKQAAAREPASAEYMTFSAGRDGGSVSKMAVVRSRARQAAARYQVGELIAAGGMATVHLGRVHAADGSVRTVAVKRLHAHLAGNPDFVQRFVDEARIASHVHHTNVVQTLDTVSIDGQLLLVLDYVHGESLARLRRLATAAKKTMPPSIASAIVIGVLRGLHAAHEATDESGAPLRIVHRDVSPQNILVGVDGVPRVLDFGIAKAAGRVSETLTRDIKGKIAYMPPEQISGEDLDRRSDLFAVGVVLWEALAGERLFRGEDAISTMDAIYKKEPPRLSERELGVGHALDDVLSRALAKSIEDRFDTADAMARALASALAPASEREIEAWVEELAGELLVVKAARVAAFEATVGAPPAMRLSMDTCPTLALEMAAAVAATESSTAVRESVPRDERSSERQPLLTPLVMIAPVHARDSVAPVGDDEPASLGETRVAPFGTPPWITTPSPMHAVVEASPTVSGAKRSGGRARRFAALALALPLLVVAAIAGGRTSAWRSAGESQAPALDDDRVAVAAPVLAPVAPPVAPAVVDAKATPAASGSAAPAEKGAAPGPHAAKATRKVSRPVRRAPRVAKPVALAGSR